MREKNIEYSNLVITAGDKYFLDIFEKDFWPLIQHGTWVGGRGEVERYLFLQTEIAKENNRVFVFGRLVKEMKLHAEQKYDHSQAQTVPSSETMESAPSSFFVILLAGHKLIFMPESNARSPQIRDLEYCFRHLLEKKWRADRIALSKAQLEKQGRKKIPRGKRDEWYLELERHCPRPSVDIRPLPSKISIEDRLDQFKRLTEIRIKAQKQNREYVREDAEFLKQLENSKNRLNAVDNAEAIFRNSKETLNRDEAKGLIKFAGDGNHLVSFSGIAKNDARVSSNLSELTYREKYRLDKKMSLSDRTRELLGRFFDAVSSRALLISAPGGTEIDKAKAIYVRQRG